MTESNNRQDSVRHYIKRDTAQARAYSQAVVTKGGRVVWLAGQVREVFSRLGQTLERILASATIRLASAVSSAKKQHSCREGPMVRIQLPPAGSQLRTCSIWRNSAGRSPARFTCPASHTGQNGSWMPTPEDFAGTRS
jgi:hypothetical protein